MLQCDLQRQITSCSCLKLISVLPRTWETKRMGLLCIEHQRRSGGTRVPFKNQLILLLSIWFSPHFFFFAIWLLCSNLVQLVFLVKHWGLQLSHRPGQKAFSELSETYYLNCLVFFGLFFLSPWFVHWGPGPDVGHVITHKHSCMYISAGRAHDLCLYQHAHTANCKMLFNDCNFLRIFSFFRNKCSFLIILQGFLITVKSRLCLTQEVRTVVCPFSPTEMSCCCKIISDTLFYRHHRGERGFVLSLCPQGRKSENSSALSDVVLEIILC